MNTKYRTRFEDLLPRDALEIPINVIGAGAVGSWVAMSLGKLGFNDIRVYDDDVVSDENIGVQFYPIKSVGMSKLDALENMVKAFSGINITKHNYKITQATPFQPTGEIVILSVDSMEARKVIAEKSFKWKCTLLIDSRMGAEYANIYTRKSSESESYFKTWHSDADSNVERCTAKATVYTANLIAGFVSKIVKDFVINQPYMRTIHYNIRDNGIVIAKAVNS